MHRKRDGWFSIGDIFNGLSGSTKKSSSPRPRRGHHFTQADQVNQLVSASEADADLGFMVRLMALCSLPRTNPGKQHQVQREGPGEGGSEEEPHHDVAGVGERHPRGVGAGGE